MVTTANCADSSSRLFWEAARDGNVGAVTQLLGGKEVGVDWAHGDEGGLAALLVAASMGHTGVVKALLRAGTAVDYVPPASGRYGPTALYRTPLVAACESGRGAVISLLLGAGADKEGSNPADGGSTPLMAACHGGHMNAVKTLLKAGAARDKIEKARPVGEVASGVREFTALSLAAGALDALKDKKLATPSLTTAKLNRRKKPELVSLLEKEGVMYNAKWSKPKLVEAIVQAKTVTRQLAIIRELLKAGVGRNTIVDGCTPLLQVRVAGRHDIAEVLLETGADKGMVAKDGYTPLMCACMATREHHSFALKEWLPREGRNFFFGRCRIETGRSCLENDRQIPGGRHANAGAGTNFFGMPNQTGGGITAAEQAAGRARKRCGLLGLGKPVVMAVLSFLSLPGKGAILDKGSRGGSTPLGLVDDADVAETLVRVGADVEKARHSNGLAPLMNAAFRNHFNVVKFLLLAGADTHKKVADGSTASHVATRCGALTSAKMLVCAGATLGSRDASERTALDWARSSPPPAQNSSEIARFLATTARRPVTLTCEKMRLGLDSGEKWEGLGPSKKQCLPRCPLCNKDFCVNGREPSTVAKRKTFTAWSERVDVYRHMQAWKATLVTMGT
jgi:ankyrin repeat protein